MTVRNTLDKVLFDEMVANLQSANQALCQQKDIELCKSILEKVYAQLEPLHYDKNVITLLQNAYSIDSSIADLYVSNGDMGRALSNTSAIVFKLLDLAEKSELNEDYVEAAKLASNAGLYGGQVYIETGSKGIAELAEDMFSIALNIFEGIDMLAELQRTRRFYGRFFRFTKDKTRFDSIFSELIQTFMNYRIIPDSGGDVEKHKEMIMDEERTKRCMRDDLRAINYESALGQHEYGKYLCEDGDIEKGIAEMKAALFIIGFLHMSAKDMMIKDRNYIPDIYKIEGDIEKFGQNMDL